MTFWQAKTKLRPADTLFSKYLRGLRGWKCERCGKDCSNNHHNLTVSHFKGRRYESVRFDPENCDCLCRSCHEWAEARKKTEYADWKLERMGEKRFNLLLIRANQKGIKDDKMIMLYLKEKMK